MGFEGKISMRVLMQMESNGFNVPGGHRRQLDKTAEYLQKLGIAVDVSSEVHVDLAGYDLVHCFGASEAIAKNTRRQRKPLALSPIYWSYEFCLKQASMQGAGAALRSELTQRVKNAAGVLLGGQKAIRKRSMFWQDQAQSNLLYRSADILMPNAHAEGDDLIRECGVLPEQVHFVPNAVEKNGWDVSPDLFFHKYGVRDFVLCVGRAEPRKNQIRLIRAARALDIPLVIVDPIHPSHAHYRSLCRKEMGKKTLYLQALSDEMLKSAFAAARVHALPSFFETTGLVSLEAVLAGCNIVVNDQSHTREYFQNMAFYCSPGDVRSIQIAVTKAYDAPYQTNLRDRILEHFTWEHTAEATLKGYERILA